MRYTEFLRRVLRPLEMLGKPVPDFSLASTDGTTFKLSALRSSKLVFYFLHSPRSLPGGIELC